jgi:hypothetical protein
MDKFYAFTKSYLAQIHPYNPNPTLPFPKEDPFEAQDDKNLILITGSPPQLKLS